MSVRRLAQIVAFLSCVTGATGLAQQTGAPPQSSRQTTRCTLVPQPTTRFSTDTIAGGGQVVFVGGGVLIRCPARGITLKGDSAEQYPDRDFMVGHVVYDEPRFHLTSDYLTHFSVEDRIVAVGNVHARLPSGSMLVGPMAEYRREMPRIRPRKQIIARARPTITVVEKDSTGKPAPPMTVIADSVFMDGDSLIYGSGQVIITRPDIKATADSAFIDQGKETMRLWQKPELVGKKDRQFTLNGKEILLFSKNRKLQRVLSREKATAVSDSMTLKSDTIDLRVRNDVLDHAYAWGTSRARAESPQQNLTADSLDVQMPNQKIQTVRALRKAFAEARTDTTRFKPEKNDLHDWLKGDTIVAHFDTTAAPNDTAKGPNIRQLTATGNARSYYHLAPNDSAETRPAIDYLVARQITIDFNDQRVATVTAVDSVSGVYVEPRADTTRTRATTVAGPGAPLPIPATPPGAPGRSTPGPKSIIPLPPKKP